MLWQKEGYSYKIIRKKVWEEKVLAHPRRQCCGAETIVSDFAPVSRESTPATASTREQNF